MPSVVDSDAVTGYCACGCGQRTTIATQTSTARGVTKGQPTRYVTGHNRRTRPNGLPAVNAQTCAGCGEELPISEFGTHRNPNTGKTYRRLKCKDCHTRDAVRWARSNRRRTRDGRLRRAYGITIEQYDAMLEAQGGVCAICGADPGERTLAVDHNHADGRVRGLLCDNCNNGLGRFQDDPELLLAAAQYLGVGA